MSAERVQAIAYGSKSSPDEKESTRSQVEHVERRVAEVGGREIVASFTEENVSGYSGDRGPELEAAISAAVAAAQEHGESELWCFHSSRLARGSGKKGEARALAKLYWDLRAEGVALRSVEDDPYCTDPHLIGITSEQNNKFSEDLSGHTKRGKAEALKAGKPQGGPTPDGYEVLREVEGTKIVRTWQPDPERAPIVTLAFDLYESGMGDGAVARELNRLGHRTKTGKSFSRRRVQDMLTNPFYAGRVRQVGEVHKGKWRRLDPPLIVQGEHPPLIDPERFDRLMTLRAQRDTAPGTKRERRGRPPTNHALAKLAVCGECGEPMRAKARAYRRKDGSQQRLYYCSTNGCDGLAQGEGPCPAPHVNAELVDAAVIRNLDKYLGDFAAWRDAIEAGQQGERERLVEEVERAESDHAAALRSVTVIEKDYERHLLAGDEGKADAALGVLEQKRADLGRTTKRLAATREALVGTANEVPQDGMLDFYNRLTAAVQGRLDGADTMQRINEALRDLFASFVLTTTTEGVEVQPVLSPATATAIADGIQAWPHGVEYGGRDVVSDPKTGALVSFGEPDEAILFEDAEVSVRPAPTLTVKQAAQAPPLRLLKVASEIDATPGRRADSDPIALPSFLVAA